MPPSTIGPTRVQAEGEPGDDAEVPATASKPPEQVRVLLVGRHDDPPVSRDHLGLEQAVTRVAELALEPAAPAAERETGHTGGGHAASGHRKAMRLGGGVDLAPGAPAADAGDARAGVDHRRHSSRACRDIRRRRPPLSR